MRRWYGGAVAAAIAIAVFMVMRWVDSGRAVGSAPINASDGNVDAPALSVGASSASVHGGSMYVDGQRSAEIRQRLVELARDAMHVDPRDAGMPAAAAEGPSPGRLTEDVEAYAGLIHEHIVHDFAPMAQGCYQDLRRRQPSASGDVVMGFTILGGPSVGGVVDSADIRGESTLRDPSLETCLRESFLAVYFDPPPISRAARSTRLTRFT